MKLIIILIALAAERFAHLGGFVNRFNWFENYLALIRKILVKTGIYKGVPAVILALLPLLIVVGVVYCTLAWIFFGLLGFLIGLLTLLYCIGPRDLYTDLEAYFSVQGQENKEAIQQALDNVGVHTSDENAIPREVTKAVFHQYNTRIFAVIFWFVILGPLGAVLYRAAAEISKTAERENSPEHELLKGSRLVLDVLDWIPVRLVGLGYALMGDFLHGFSYWVKNVISKLHNNKKFMEQSGLIALRLNKKDKDAHKVGVEENKEALALIDRASILYLVVMALFILGAWIY